MSWEALRTMAAVISALCALIAAGVSLAVWRKARSSDLGKKIEDGDKSVRQYAERVSEEFREALEQVQEGLARVETLQETEAKHMVRHNDLSRIHDKINRVAEDSAATREAVRGVNEQLRIIQQHLLKGGGR